MNGNRGKKLVSLATAAVLPVFSEDNIFLGDINTSYNMITNNQNFGQLIKISESCIIKDDSCYSAVRDLNESQKDQQSMIEIRLVENEIEGFNVIAEQIEHSGTVTDTIDCDNISDHQQTSNISIKGNVRSVEERDPNELIEMLTILCVSVDFQKVIMLLKLEMFKKVIFTHRLIVYNEIFMPVGKIKRGYFPFAVLWHEAVSGCNQEDIISAFNAFFNHNKDINHFILWLDNCSSENKNWVLFSYLIYIINFPGISAEMIKINYFEPEHIFMSADSFYHQIEQSLKRKKKIYDFDDVVNAVQISNKGKVHIKCMSLNNFYSWKNLSSASKIEKHFPKVYISKITEVLVRRNEFIIYYKCKNDEKWKDLDFLQKKYINNVPIPSIKTIPNGFEKKKTENILKNLADITPENRKRFWLDLIEKII